MTEKLSLKLEVGRLEKQLIDARGEAWLHGQYAAHHIPEKCGLEDRIRKHALLFTLTAGVETLSRAAATGEPVIPSFTARTVTPPRTTLAQYRSLRGSEKLQFLKQHKHALLAEEREERAAERVGRAAATHGKPTPITDLFSRRNGAAKTEFFRANKPALIKESRQ